MRNPILLFSIGLTLLFTIQSFSQNKPKHIGCWKVTELKIFQKDETSKKAEIEAKNAIICFFEDGTFSNKNSKNNIEILKGLYTISEDNKTINQWRDEDDEEDAIPMKIVRLTEKEFIIETEGIAKMTLQKID